MYVNHVLQAEGIKFGLEGHRRAKPYCMGSLYWQINDCWPVASWSSTDYYQKWKALQYFVKKGFELTLVSPYIDDKKFKVAIVNDRLDKVNGELKLKLLDFNCKVIWQETSQVEIRPIPALIILIKTCLNFWIGKIPGTWFLWLN